MEDQLEWGGEVDQREEDCGGHQEGADEDGGRLRRDEEADYVGEEEDECRKTSFSTG